MNIFKIFSNIKKSLTQKTTEPISDGWQDKNTQKREIYNKLNTLNKFGPYKIKKVLEKTSGTSDGAILSLNGLKGGIKLMLKSNPVDKTNNNDLHLKLMPRYEVLNAGTLKKLGVLTVNNVNFTFDKIPSNQNLLVASEWNNDLEKDPTFYEQYKTLYKNEVRYSIDGENADYPTLVNNLLEPYLISKKSETRNFYKSLICGITLGMTDVSIGENLMFDKKQKEFIWVDTGYCKFMGRAEDKKATGGAEWQRVIDVLRNFGKDLESSKNIEDTKWLDRNQKDINNIRDWGKVIQGHKDYALENIELKNSKQKSKICASTNKAENTVYHLKNGTFKTNRDLKLNKMYKLKNGSFIGRF